MGILVSYFDSVEGLSKFVDSELKSATALRSYYLKKIENTRVIHTKSVGSGKMEASNSSRRSGRQDEVAGFKILFDPSVQYELSLLDNALRTVYERIDSLERIKTQLLPRLNQGKSVSAIIDDGIPIAFMYYTRD